MIGLDDMAGKEVFPCSVLSFPAGSHGFCLLAASVQTNVFLCNQNCLLNYFHLHLVLVLSGIELIFFIAVPMVLCLHRVKAFSVSHAALPVSRQGMGKRQGYQHV